VLILICASLIALTRSLVVIRPRLILITRGLVAITRPLIAITPRVVTQLITRSGRELGAAGRTPRNAGRLAAGRTFHSHRHHLRVPERALGERQMVAAFDRVVRRGLRFEPATPGSRRQRRLMV
jgi:hypothetical protein